MMKRVAKAGNPHVVSLIGCVTAVEPMCLVIEYLKYGDLLSYLHTIKQEVTIKAQCIIIKNNNSMMKKKIMRFVPYNNTLLPYSWP